ARSVAARGLGGLLPAGPGAALATLRAMLDDTALRARARAFAAQHAAFDESALAAHMAGELEALVRH
ncbi:MAG: hypothetical protein RLW62_18540, partial [Gammaproteobacteria bacterium]